MSNPSLDSFSTAELLAALGARGEAQAAAAQAAADARHIAAEAKREARRKELAFQALRQAQESEQRFRDKMEALDADKARQAKVEALNAAKRDELRLSFMELAESDWMPTGDSEIDGSSRWDDFDREIPFDLRAIDAIEGSTLKFRLAQSLNMSTVESAGDGPTWRLQFQWRYAIGTNRFYKGYIITNPFMIGDNHRLMNGEMGVAGAVLSDTNTVPTFDSADTPNGKEQVNTTTFYAVEWVKRDLDMRKKSAQNLWLKLHPGRTLPTITDSNGNKVVRDQFILEPTRYIRIGQCFTEVGPGVSMGLIDPVYDEDGKQTNREEFLQALENLRNRPTDSLTVQSLADETVDAAYWWSQEIANLTRDRENGTLEGETIPGARQYGADYAISVQHISDLARQQQWTTYDFDVYVKRLSLKGGRGVNPNGKTMQAIRATLPQAVQ